jgi:hypothetical protein
MDYLLRAQALGHDIRKLKKGEIIRSTVSIRSLDEFKSIFANNLTAEQRALHSKQVSGLPLGDYPGATAMARLGAHIWGDKSLSSADVEFAKSIFPLKVDVVSGSDVTITTDEVIGPAAAPQVVNAGTLTFAGGSITLMNTVFTVSADTLVLDKLGTTPYHIGILGATGAEGSTGSTGSTTPGQAQNGSNISAPTPGICTGVGDGGTGSPGAAGGVGGIGGIGGSGAASLTATVTIGSFPNPGQAAFVINTQSGGGGQGGTGGTGGAGQQGGNGGSGCNSGCEGTDGGNGGNGGAGGTGGIGGVGGAGVDGSPISISFPAGPNGSPNPLLVLNSAPAPAGTGGSGGVAGLGGAGGNAGSGGKHKSDGQSGSSGANGQVGNQGLPGGTTGAPAHFNVNWT